MTVLVLGALHHFARPFSAAYVELAASLTLMVGVLPAPVRRRARVSRPGHPSRDQRLRRRGGAPHHRHAGGCRAGRPTSVRAHGPSISQPPWPRQSRRGLGATFSSPRSSPPASASRPAARPLARERRTWRSRSWEATRSAPAFPARANLAGGARGARPIYFFTVLALIVTLCLGPLFAYLPRFALAAVVIMAVAGLLDLRRFVALCRADTLDALVALATFSVTLLVGPERGILTGIVAAALGYCWRTWRVPTARNRASRKRRELSCPRAV